MQEGNHYFLEKDGRKTSITKAAYDYASYLQEQDEAQNMAQSAKDIDVPGKDVTDTNVGNRLEMSMEDAVKKGGRKKRSSLIPRFLSATHGSGSLCQAR